MNKRTCTMPECNRAHRARGLCASHYNQEHAPDRHAKKLVACAWCGIEVLKHSGGGRKYGQVCSDQCRQWLATPHCTLPKDHWARWHGASSRWPRITSPSEASLQRMLDQAERTRSPLAVAVRDGDHSEVIRIIKSDCLVTESGCWEWQRRLKNGYAEVWVNTGLKKTLTPVHRLSLEAKHGKSLGQQAAHHMCANTRCVNPDHLQPVTHRENIAEMLERKYYIARISELEAALTAINSNHPLLKHVSIPAAA